MGRSMAMLELTLQLLTGSMCCRVLRFEFETSGQLKMRAFLVLSALAIAVAGFVVLLLVRSIMVRSTNHLQQGLALHLITC